MKFLLFNASVICALYYLFSGFDGYNPETVKSKVSTLIEDTVAATSPISSKIEVPTTPVARSNPEAAVSSSDALDTIAKRLEYWDKLKKDAVPDKPVPLPIKETEVTQRGLPDYNQETAGYEHPTTDKTKAPSITPDASDFISPRERWQQLHKLAEDMELVFISRLTQ
jgi:hypothetical protein